MTWETIDVNSNPEGSPWVKIGCHGRKTGSMQIQFTMSRSVVRYLGAEDGDRVEVLRGHDDHGGWVCLRRGPGVKNGGRQQDGFIVTGRNMGKGNLALRMSARHLGIFERHSFAKMCGESLVFKKERVDVGHLIPANHKTIEEWSCVYVELPPWARGEA